MPKSKARGQESEARSHACNKPTPFFYLPKKRYGNNTQEMAKHQSLASHPACCPPSRLPWLPFGVRTSCVGLHTCIHTFTHACVSATFNFNVQDARDLYAKIKDSLDREQWNAEDNEEYEDGEGNVLNRRTYEDLARQGLM